MNNISRNQKRRVETNENSEENEEELIQEINNRRRLRQRLRRINLDPLIDWNQGQTQIQRRIEQENLATALLGLDGAYRGNESSSDSEDSIEETDEEEEEEQAPKILLARLRTRIERLPILLESLPEATGETAR